MCKIFSIPDYYSFTESIENVFVFQDIIYKLRSRKLYNSAIYLEGHLLFGVSDLCCHVCCYCVPQSIYASFLSLSQLLGTIPVLARGYLRVVLLLYASLMCPLGLSSSSTIYSCCLQIMSVVRHRILPR